MNKQIREDINRVIELNKILESQSEVGESGFSSVGRQFRGSNPRVKTIAIISAENPCGSDLSRSENNQLTNKLITRLSSDYYDFIEGERIGYRPIKGMYNNPENSFIINNITKDDAMKIGDDFKQESIIFGERYEEDDQYGMKFQMIVSHICPEKTKDPIGTIWGESKVFINLRKNTSDFYSEIKGRKFLIPFFDVDRYVKDLDDDGNEKFDNNGEVLYKYVGKNDYGNANWEGDSGKIKDIMFKPFPLVKENMTLPIREQFERAIEGSLTLSSPKSRKIRRGYILNILRRYKY